jgi:tRNA G18 (ribose-2'-O)-methylase SpoU
MNKFVVIFENIRSVYNVGAIFRSMEGFGINEAALIGITPTPIDKFGLKRKDFVKTALGAEDRIDWKYFETNLACLEFYKDYAKQNNLNLKIVSLEKNDVSISLSQSHVIQNIKSKNLESSNLVLLVLGSEVDGVSELFLNNSNEVVEIPMSGTKESFNVSVASGILFYELRR